ncbi:MAG: nitroreductase family protein [Candidatus Hodarchaeota archaeon]
MNESSFFSVIRYRRSVREYDPRPIEDWKLQIVLEAARLAPSSTNSQPWRLIVVKDAGLRAELAVATPQGIRKHPWMNQSPVVIVLCALPSFDQRFGQLIGKDYHLVDMGIVGTHLVLMAAELGLGTCWVGWVHKKRVKKMLNIPKLWEVVCLISLGYPKNPDEPDMKEKFTSVEPLQEAGEKGIGGIDAKDRKPTEEIIFYDKV